MCYINLSFLLYFTLHSQSNAYVMHMSEIDADVSVKAAVCKGKFSQ